MKRWLTNLGAGLYLAAIFWGLCAHAFYVEIGARCLMYFLTFNMFSGWCGYEARMYVLGEGESGKVYQLAPGPWGEFCPYAKIGRQHYDQEFENGFRLAQNCLKHTVHEPMVRIFVVEAEHPKKFNLPDDQYRAYFNKPKEFHQYCHTKMVLTADGSTLSQQQGWLVYQDRAALCDNPRLIAETNRNRAFIPPTRPLSSSPASLNPYAAPSATQLSAPAAE